MVNSGRQQRRSTSYGDHPWTFQNLKIPHPMILYILRHGIAVEPGNGKYPNDADRPLTAEGKRKVRKIGKAIKWMEVSFDRILSSPYVRARQTAGIVAAVLGCEHQVEFTSSLTPGRDPADCLELLSRVPGKKGRSEEVLLVGHEPYLSTLVSLLISGHNRSRVLLKKGGLCKISAESLRPGHGELEWLLTPKHLTRLG